MTNFTVGDYLLLRFKEIGAKHIFGVAGDYFWSGDHSHNLYLKE
jgi:TPP-dependent 2-oxoacid decarboxylase